MHSISGGSMDDIKVLTELNEQFIEAFRQGSWELLSPILSPDFAYLDGATGETWSEERYVENLRKNPSPSLVIDQLAVHADGDSGRCRADRSLAGANDAGLVGEDDRLHAVAQVELAEDVRDVRLDGVLGDDELPRDLGIRESARDEA